LETVCPREAELFLEVVEAQCTGADTPEAASCVVHRGGTERTARRSQHPIEWPTVEMADRSSGAGQDVEVGRDVRTTLAAAQRHHDVGRAQTVDHDGLHGSSDGGRI
jgi:hypothetical protein